MLGGTETVKISERAVQIVRTGRKRKKGYRKASGDLVLDSKLLDLAKTTAETQPHRQSVSASLRFDAKAATSLGRLHLKGVINLDQYTAGDTYARRFARYVASIEAPFHGGSIAGIMQPTGGQPMTVDAAKDAREKYNELFECFGSGRIGQIRAKVVARACIHDLDVFSSQHDFLKEGLDLLVHKLGLTRNRKSL